MSTRDKTFRLLPNVVVAFAVIFPLAFFSACSQEVNWISVDPKSLELNKMGETMQIQFTPLDKENKPVADAMLTWESSNPSVANVDNNGLVKAKGSGQSILTVTAPNGEHAVVQCKVSILSAIKVIPEELQVKVGEKRELEAKVLNEKGELFEDQNVGWASSNHDVVFVDDLGGITAVAPGTTTITATTPSKDLGHVYGKATVTVIAADAE